uniref:DUF7657 domain-containing protein n=1 Tax=Candidatus Ruminimicrobium bovinum TaxID=3242779 RepID=UPI0039B8B979
IIFGKARNIRTDEYQTYTPILLSQNPNYPYFNKILRGTTTDVAMTYGQPIKNIISVFRPFLSGFLFLGSAKGLSFFWIVRLVFLFLFTFEFLLLITNKNKILSLFGTLLITFSPAIHWWFTCNGIVEMIIYGELAILMLNRYMLIKNFIERFFILLITYICVGGFILTLYPAWQVPCAYIFAALFLWVIIKNYTQFEFDKKDLSVIIFFSALFILIFLFIYDKSKETINIVTNTLYPGLRSELGGDSLTEVDINCGFLTQIFRYWGNMFLPIFDKNLVWNPCLYSTFFDLFPIGLILSAIVFFIDKNKDKLLILLSVIFVFLSAWCFIGFPQSLANLTMLKSSPAYRTIIIWGFLNVLILIRALSIIKFKLGNLMAITVTAILTIWSVVANKLIYQGYMDVFKLSVIFVLSYFLFYSILKNKINKFFIAIIMVIMFVSGLAVNPIQRGISVIKEAPLAKAIKNINTKEPGLWVFETGQLVYYFIMNYPIMQCAATFNSINIYPNLEGFKKIDKENKYFNVYNRYCHISVNLVDINNIKNKNFEKFILLGQDYIAINMTEDDLIALNIKYILTLRNLRSFNSPKVKYELLYNTSKCAIYKLHYQKQ